MILLSSLVKSSYPSVLAAISTWEAEAPKDGIGIELATKKKHFCFDGVPLVDLFRGNLKHFCLLLFNRNASPGFATTGTSQSTPHKKELTILSDHFCFLWLCQHMNVTIGCQRNNNVLFKKLILHHNSENKQTTQTKTKNILMMLVPSGLLKVSLSCSVVIF